MKELINAIKKLQSKPFYKRYDAVHFAIGYFGKEISEGSRGTYSAVEVLDLLKAVAAEIPERR